MVFYDATQVEFYTRPLAAILTNIKTSVCRSSPITTSILTDEKARIVLDFYHLPKSD